MRGSAQGPWLTAAAALLCLCGCKRERSAASEPLLVVRVSPDPGAGDAVGRLFLNQELTIYFNQAINPLSVTSESVQVLDDQGYPARGSLRVGSHSVTFLPEPPLDPELMDGSFHPDREYRLVVSGYPRYFNSIQSDDKQILPAPLVLRYRTVKAQTGLPGFPSPLLPVGTGTEPFLLRNTADAQRVLVADPRLRLHFTLPILPPSLSPEAFEILLLRDKEPVRVLPRGLRLLSELPPVDEHPGCTVELDLGQQLQVEGEDRPHALEAGDFVFVRLTTGPQALVDYRGGPVQMPPEGAAQAFQFVHGDRLALLEWPADARVYLAEDSVLPGFEVLRDGSIRPRVRVEAGTGELGVFRPKEDVVLDPSVPFRRADGDEVRLAGRSYHFLAVDIPPGVEVTLVGDDVRILSCGSIHVGGVLRIPGRARGTLFRTGERVPAETLLSGATVALVAAGDIRVSGTIEAGGREGSPVTLLAGGRIDLQGAIPPRSVLAVEVEPGVRRTFGPAQQPITVVTSMSPGVPSGTLLLASGWTDWQRPRSGSEPILQVRVQRTGAVEVGYQTASPDPVRPESPDLRPAALPPPRQAVDGTLLPLPVEGFVRFSLRASVRGGVALPQVRGLRVVGQ